MSTVLDVANDMSGWVDAHVAFSGYRADPLEGEAFSPFSAIYEQSERFGLAGIRQLGAAIEFVAFDENFGDPQRNLNIVRSGPYLEPKPQGFRLTRSVVSAEQIERAIEWQRAEGLEWITLGSGLSDELVSLAIELCATAGLRVAVEATPSRLQFAGRVDSFEGLLGALVPVGSADDGIETWKHVADLVERPLEAHLEAVAPLTESTTVLVPMVVSVRRACLLTEVISAPGMAELCRILPFHARIAELRNPGAYRFGKKHAEKYLNLPRLSRADTAAFEQGWRRLCEVLAGLLDQSTPVAGGSGAPGTGLAPGFALAEEARAWAEAGIPREQIVHSFTNVGARLLKVEAPVSVGPRLEAELHADRRVATSQGESSE